MIPPKPFPLSAFTTCTYASHGRVLQRAQLPGRQRKRLHAHDVRQLQPGWSVMAYWHHLSQPAATAHHERDGTLRCRFGTCVSSEARLLDAQAQSAKVRAGRFKGIIV